MEERDETTGATYYQVNNSPVVRTVSISDLIMVDVDENDDPVGLEFAMDPSLANYRELAALVDRFPSLVAVVRKALSPQPPLYYQVVAGAVMPLGGLSVTKEVRPAPVTVSVGHFQAQEPAIVR